MVTIIMSINSTYSYITTKDKTIKKMKEDSRTTALSLRTSVANMISAYSVNEYEKLLYNEIKRRDIFAIIVEDYNMGKILGEKSLASGKIKPYMGKPIDYNPTNKEHKALLENTFYSDSYGITSITGEELGTLSIYISDDSMKKQLQGIIFENIKNTLAISLLLIISLFISIRLFILKPISNIIETIANSDKDGIPLHLIPYNGFTEISNLSDNINKMINGIKRSQIKLKNSQNRLQYLLELSPIAVRIAKKRGKDVIFANKAYSKLLRLQKDETIHKNPQDYYAHKSVYDEIIQKLDNNESIYNIMVELTINQERVWALASYMNIEFDGEKAVIGWFYDVTAEKNNEAKLHEALELQTTIFDNSGYMLIRTDTKGVIQQINKAAEDILGYTAEELVGNHTPEIIHLHTEFHSRSQEFTKELNQNVEPGFNVFIIKSKLNLPNIHEWTYVTKEGKQIPVLLEVTALKNNKNEIYGYLGVAKDITQTKLIESQSKLASMGEMIGNIAHQWRQPLSAISTIASGIRVKSEFDQLNTEELLNDMDNITEQTQYLSRTIDDFRNFIKNSNDKDNLSVKKTIEKALSIIDSSMKNHQIKLVLELEDDLTINGFENQLLQSIINILNNAKDAVKENIKENDERIIFISTHKKQNDLILNIKDNGGGIEENIIHNIFEPYFTTKHQSVGTGIGLSMAYQIITEHHKGTIEVTNESYTYEDRAYKGAAFKITFKA